LYTCRPTAGKFGTRPQRIKGHSGLLKFEQSWTRGAQITSAMSPWRLNILECRLVFLNPQYGTCLLSSFRRLELWGGSEMYEKLVHSWFWTTAGHKPHYTLPIPNHIVSLKESWQTNETPLRVNINIKHGIWISWSIAHRYTGTLSYPTTRIAISLRPLRVAAGNQVLAAFLIWRWVEFHAF